MTTFILDSDFGNELHLLLFICCQVSLFCSGLQAKSLRESPIFRSHEHHRSRETRGITCDKELKDEVHGQWATHFAGQYFHPSYRMVPSLRQEIDAELNRSSNPDSHYLYGGQECPNVTAIQGGESIDERSLCPWYSVINHDVARYPYDIVEAECRCQTCVGFSHVSGTGCEKIYYNIPVLRRTGNCDDNGRYEYAPSWHRLAAGCVCAMTRS